MFATHESFKFPVQIDTEFTTWHGVELFSFSPWLIVTIDDHEEEADRTFLLNGVSELMQLIRSKSLRRVCSVDLAMPPRRPGEDPWRLVPIRHVDCERQSLRSRVPAAVLTTDEGQRYGGFPIESVVREESELVRVVDLPGELIPFDVTGP